MAFRPAGRMGVDAAAGDGQRIFQRPQAGPAGRRHRPRKRKGRPRSSVQAPTAFRRSRSSASRNSETCVGASTRNSAWVKSRPTLTPRSPRMRLPKASSSVVSSPANTTAVAPVAWRRKEIPSPLEAWTTEVSSTRFPVLRKTPGRSCRAALAAATASSATSLAASRVCSTTPAGLSSSRVPGACSTISARIRRTSASSSRWASSSTSSVEPGPIQTSAPWLPISSVCSGGEATARRLSRARPEMSAVVVRGSSARAAKAAAERGSARESSAWSTSGAMVPSKSIATSSSSVPATRCTASSSSGERESEVLAGSASGVIADHLFLQRAKEVGGPEVDVVGQDLLADGAHPACGLGGLHVNRAHDGVLEPVDVVRIHQEGLLELVRGAGEFTEHQGAVVVRPGRDVFLGDQVHAVAQGCDEHDVGGQVQRNHFLDRVAVVQVPDGGVLHRVVGAIDVADGALDFLAQQAVLFDALAAGAGHLDQGRVLHRDFAVLQEFLVRLEPVPDALGVVQPVDAEQDGLGVAEVPADLLRPLDYLRLLRQLADLLDINGDRERLGPRDVGGLAIGAPDMDLLLLDARAKEAPCGAHEVSGIAAALEAHQVRTQQAVDDRPAPRELGKDLRRREGDVVEEPDLQIRPGFPEQLGNQLELVVLHPDGGTLGRMADDGVGEPPVDLPVRIPPGAVELRR